jgi:hypothetical protein
MFKFRSPFRRLLACAALFATLLVAALPQLASAQTDQRCFPETGQCMSGRIREFWEQNGGLPVFGFPIGPQQEEQIEGKPFQVQWFERNRLELHPENARPYDVLLGRLGADRLGQQGRDWAAFPKSAQQAGCRFFAETGHNVCGDILTAWRASGLEFDGRAGKSEAENLALFGLPLSEPQQEDTPSGRFTVQHFERARFEQHPENQPPYNVLLGLLGKEVRDAASAPAPTPAPTDACADVPEPVSGRIRPGKCVTQGDPITIEIFGFTPDEQVGYWITAPDGSIFGTRQTASIGSSGGVVLEPFATGGVPPGLYYFVFEGVSSKHQSIVYFKILARPTAAPTSCEDVPEPVNGRIRPGKCNKAGDPIVVDFYGFEPNEQTGFWITAPDGSIFGTRETYNIGPSGSVEGFPLNTTDAPPGIYYIVFEGVSSKHQSIIYFKVIPG